MANRSLSVKCCVISAALMARRSGSWIFQPGGYAITNEEDFSLPDEELTREEQALDAPDILAIKDWGNSSASRLPARFA